MAFMPTRSPPNCLTWRGTSRIPAVCQAEAALASFKASVDPQAERGVRQEVHELQHLDIAEP